MVMLLGEMQLPVTQDPDPVRTYLNGTAPSGGLWTALGRASDHDHTGGLNGKTLTIAAIPDGSITTAKLDPAVLAPYALTDGSKPFTGQVAMNADAIVRDTLFFGAKPAGAGDNFLRRTGANALRTDSNVGVGVAPAGWDVNYRAVQLGTGAVWGSTSVAEAYLSSNTYYDGTGYKALITAAAGRMGFAAGQFYINTAPSVAAGAAQTFTTRLTVAPNGTLTLTPDAGQAAVVAHGDLYNNTGNLVLRSTNHILVAPGAGSNHLPSTDNGFTTGYPGYRWVAVYAVNGTIQTSSLDMKENVHDLDPALALEAVLNTPVFLFNYKNPPPPDPLPEGYETPPQFEHAGYDAATADPLLVMDDQSVNAQNTASVLMAAIQEIATRLKALETRAN